MYAMCDNALPFSWRIFSFTKPICNSPGVSVKYSRMHDIMNSRKKVQLEHLRYPETKREEMDVGLDHACMHVYRT
jgi:hypothetical protein